MFPTARMHVLRHFQLARMRLEQSTDMLHIELVQNPVDGIIVDLEPSLM
jgi:hypothetical protein